MQNPPEPQDEIDEEMQARRAVREAIQRKIAADNEREREARNARRWKVERDPAEYERQKERQRQQYIPKHGGPVRPYEKIVATTKAEREEQAKARHAEREKNRYASMTPAERQAKSDRVADEAWAARRRDKGVPEDIIQAGLAIRIQEREAKRAVQAQVETAEEAMRNLPHFGMMGSG
ncbi:MAG: hypothetical protein WCZ72_09465 [Gemmobacter sp.]